MYNSHIQYGPRYLGAAVLSAGIILLGIVGWLRSRQSGSKGVLTVLCGYNMLLMALFILGLLADDGFGWAFFPLMVSTAPWSFVLPPILLHWTNGNWFGFDLIGNFTLLVLVCGGINSALLYLLMRKTIHPTTASTKVQKI